MADRLSKAWAFINLVTQDIHLVPGVSFELAWNRGISYGMLRLSFRRTLLDFDCWYYACYGSTVSLYAAHGS